MPDGNKRAGWVALRVFLDVNGWRWAARPIVDEAEHLVVGVAAGEQDEDAVAAWLRVRLAAAEE